VSFRGGTPLKGRGYRWERVRRRRRSEKKHSPNYTRGKKKRLYVYLGKKGKKLNSKRKEEGGNECYE